MFDEALDRIELATRETAAEFAAVTSAVWGQPSSERLCERVAAVQRLINSAHAVQTVLLAQLAATEEEVGPEGPVVSHRPIGHVSVDAPSLVSGELGVSERVATRRVGAAADIAAKLPLLLERMAAGRVDLVRVEAVSEELELADPVVSGEVERSVVEGVESDTPGPARRRCRRALNRVAPDLLVERVRRARSRRGLTRWQPEPGIVQWEAQLPVEEGALAWEAVTRVAARIRREGGAENLEQARADALIELMRAQTTVSVELNITVPTDPDETPAGARPRPQPSPGYVPSRPSVPGRGAGAGAGTPAGSGADPAESTPLTSGPAGRGRGGSGLEGSRRCASDRTSPPGQVSVAPARSSGTAGPAPAADPTTGRATARDEVLFVGGVGEVAASDLASFLATLPVHVGTLCHERRTGLRRVLAAETYRPPPWLSRIIRARDGHCRFPRCTVSARHCDVDHVRPWPAGRTEETNLVCLCRRHHRIKQRPRWLASLTPDGRLTWTSPVGRRDVTVPELDLARLLEVRPRELRLPRWLRDLAEQSDRAGSRAADAREPEAADLLRQVSILEDLVHEDLRDPDRDLHRSALLSRCQREVRFRPSARCHHQIPADVTAGVTAGATADSGEGPGRVVGSRGSFGRGSFGWGSFGRGSFGLGSPSDDDPPPF